MTPIDHLRLFLEAVLPSGWRIQAGQWRDDGAGRFCVIRPVAGLAAGLLRRPQFTVWLIGQQGDTFTAINTVANQVLEAMRADSGALVYLEAGEPAFNPTADGRQAFEIAVSAITT
jgi:hypothetical protein